jgi:hypothetical protein
VPLAGRFAAAAAAKLPGDRAGQKLQVVAVGVADVEPAAAVIVIPIGP